MLHILNGESTEAILSQTAIGGERFSFRDALIAGPAPAVNGSDWRRIRATHIAEAYGVEIEKCEDGFARQQQIFESFDNHKEVTLWFESDLFCQANLLYMLDWCAQRHPATKLSLICIGEFSGRPNFRGLGELTPPELASLFDKRSEITTGQLELAVRAWQAYRSKDPRELERLLQTDTSALPFLDAALKLQLTRFPSARNGLNKIENTGLELIDQGASRFGDLFSRFVAAEPNFGLGDAQFWNALQQLKQGPSPLLTIEGDRDAISESAFAITAAGKSVLSGVADRVTLNGIEDWLGGVHLQGHANIWRWDETQAELVMI
ncbi:MAG: hypothetical protein ACR2H6_13405 [Pyrinomonadaceae bacterium]